MKITKIPFTKYIGIKAKEQEHLRLELSVTMKKFVGYGFSLPSKLSLFNIRISDLLEFSFIGRLKPYPTNLFQIITSFLARFYFMPNLTYFSQKQFFNVKIIKKS